LKICSFNILFYICQTDYMPLENSSALRRPKSYFSINCSSQLTVHKISGHMKLCLERGMKFCFLKRRHTSLTGHSSLQGDARLQKFVLILLSYKKDLKYVLWKRRTSLWYVCSADHRHWLACCSVPLTNIRNVNSIKCRTFLTNFGLNW